jgi:hypothetical protein
MEIVGQTGQTGEGGPCQKLTLKRRDACVNFLQSFRCLVAGIPIECRGQAVPVEVVECQKRIDLERWCEETSSRTNLRLKKTVSSNELCFDPRIDGQSSAVVQEC